MQHTRATMTRFARVMGWTVAIIAVYAALTGAYWFAIKDDAAYPLSQSMEYAFYTAVFLVCGYVILLMPIVIYVTKGKEGFDAFMEDDR